MTRRLRDPLIDGGDNLREDFRHGVLEGLGDGAAPVLSCAPGRGNGSLLNHLLIAESCHHDMQIDPDVRSGLWPVDVIRLEPVDVHPEAEGRPAQFSWRDQPRWSLTGGESGDQGLIEEDRGGLCPARISEIGGLDPV